MRHHQTTFEAAEFVLGPASATTMACFEACRRKRNLVDYDRAYVASRADATPMLAAAHTFRHVAETWIAQNHPQLV